MFDVYMKPDTWMALAFGQGMFNVDMMRFSAQGVDDLWSTGYREPSFDDSQDFQVTYQGETIVRETMIQGEIAYETEEFGNLVTATWI